MDDPVTDVVIVSSRDNCPSGYRLIEACPCGHEAQLWEKVLGGESAERFLCFTKEDKDGMVIEDMYVPRRGTQYLYQGYKIITKTVEGDDPMYHQQLAMKKVPKTHASKVIADIIICRSRDNVSKMYTKLNKVNGLCICYRQMDINGRNSPTATRRPPSLKDSSKSNSLQLHEVDEKMSEVSVTDGGSARRNTLPINRTPSPSYSPAFRRSVSPLATTTRQSPSPIPPSHPQSPSLPVAVFHETQNSESLLPPSAPPPTTLAPSALPPSVLPPMTSNVSTATYPPPPLPPYQTSPHTNPSVSPSTDHPPSSTYPPPSSSSTYPPPPSSTYPPPPPSSSSSSSSHPPYFGFGGVAGGVQPMGGYLPNSYASPHPLPPSTGPMGYGDYGSVAGSSFGTAPVPAAPRGPAPFNPYQAQSNTPYFPPGQQSSSNYGFKF